MHYNEIATFNSFLHDNRSTCDEICVVNTFGTWKQNWEDGMFIEANIRFSILINDSIIHTVVIRIFFKTNSSASLSK